MIKFVVYSPPGKIIIFSGLFYRKSSALIEPQSAWNVRLDRRIGGLDLDVLLCRSKHSDGPETAQKYAFRDPKMKILLVRGH